MNKLSKNIKTHVIISYTGSHYFITAKQNELLKRKGLHEAISIDGSVIHIKNIAEVMTIAKYYETYPEKRPEDSYTYPNFTAGVLTPIKKEKRKVILEKMINGLKGYINSDHYQRTQEPLKLLKQMENSLKELK